MPDLLYKYIFRNMRMVC